MDSVWSGTAATTVAEEVGDGVLSTRVAARIGATLVVVSGVLTITTLILPSPPSLHRAGILLVAAAAILIGAICWLLPWHRWPRRAMFGVLLLAFALIALHNHFSGADPYRYGLLFIVAFIWIGLAFPAWTSLAFVPPFLVAYIVPLFTAGAYSPASLATVVYTMPICLLAAETVAWVGARLQATQQSLRRSDHRFRALVQHSSDMIAVVDASGYLLYVSPSIESLMGYTPQQLIGTVMLDRLHPEDRARRRAPAGVRRHTGGHRLGRSALPGRRRELAAG